MPQTRKKPRVLSLFTGAGGLDLGLEKAGFEVALCVELDASCRNTLATNRPRWPLATPGDALSLTGTDVRKQGRIRKRQLDLLAGGPPCQPFSKSGYWATGDAARLDDPRASTLDAYLRLVEETLPRVVLLENVRGIAFNNKDEGLGLLKQQLSRINRRQETNYQMTVFCLNAADYGVPQLRERVFVIASRDGQPFEVPGPTHTTARSSQTTEPHPLEPHRTAWDAIGDLDTDDWPTELAPRGKWSALLPSIPEGENYLWHTTRSRGEPIFGWRTRFWSFLLKLAKNQPSWTIQAQPGPATGPFHWRSRQLSTRELARLQTFPDDYQFVGERRSIQMQIGNAVPPAIGELLGKEIQRQFFGRRVRKQLSLIPERRKDVPAPEKALPVPRKLLKLRDDHAPHPGVGMGPAARERQVGED